MIREGTTMADVKPSCQSPPYPRPQACEGRVGTGLEHSKPYSRSDELELLREETKRLRELVVQLSKMAIKNAVNAK